MAMNRGKLQGISGKQQAKESLLIDVPIEVGVEFCISQLRVTGFKCAISEGEVARKQNVVV